MAKWFYSITAVFGGVVGYLTGEWSAPMYALLVLMGIDFITGIIKGAMSKSEKTENHRLQSSVMFVGLLRKVTCLFVVAAAHWMDIVLNITVIRDACVMCFIANELLSLIENCGAIGIPIPEKLRNCVEELKS